MPNDNNIEQTLRQLLEIDNSIPIIKTELAAIIPAGAPLAYSLSNEGKIIGIKLHFEYFNKKINIDKEIFKWIYNQTSLQRLVLTSENFWELPQGISKLKKLFFFVLI